MMRASRIFFSILPAPKKKNNRHTQVRSNEPPCLVHRICMHESFFNLYFFTAKKKIIIHKSVFKRAPVSHAERAPVSRACMHEFFLFILRAKKINNLHTSVFKRAPVSHAERAPVSRARTCACMHESFFFFPFPQKKITSTKVC